MVQGIPYKLLCDDIHNCIAVSDDGIQFFVKSGSYDVRQVRTIDIVCFLVADIPEIPV